MSDITECLFAMQDTEYRGFQCKLMPTVDADTVIGVRTPQLRLFAKQLSAEAAERFLSELPHKYYEENNLHGFLIEKIKDYDACIAELNRFLPYVNNWATCDMMTPKVLKKHLPELLEQIRIWISSRETYTVRFAIKMLMSFYLDEHFKQEYIDLVLSVKSDEYYIKMMIAWYVATALAKQYDAVLPYIENSLPDKWVHNKAIQKAVESYRISEEQKEYLKKFKIR